MNYIQVKLLTGYHQPLTYSASESLSVGTLVRVPLRGREVSAVVIASDVTHTASFAVRDIIGVEAFPADPHYYTYINKVAGYYQIDPSHLFKRVRSFLTQKEMDPDAAVPAQAASESAEKTLTAAQEAVVTAIAPAVQTPTFAPTLLHGVTGSGKTVAYQKLIEQALACGGSAILLLPEVTMAVTFEMKFKSWLPTDTVYGFHSATSVKEKRALWHALIHNKPILIVGVHLPALLPISNLRLIVVDEEHEIGFQEKRHPKINSKEAAIIRAQQYQIPIILGSATPSITSMAQVKTRGWNFLQLKERFAGSFPTIRVVPLLDKKRRKHFWITKELETAIAQRLERKEQTIIFLNRRGYCFFVQCKSCSFVFSCSSCSVSLTLHQQSQPTLRCHYCDYTRPLPTTCPTCSSGDLIKKGIGTQQIVTILEQCFPTARIGRVDLDATVARKKWQETTAAMERQEIDILVGTQTITKGHHFPAVTLVGILWADINLNFPIFNAAETCLAQLIQVAGRAGRATDHSEVIVQTMLEHPIFNYLNEVDYLKFYAHEITQRQAIGYPPCKRLVELELKHSDEDTVEHEARALVSELFAYNDKTVQILGPAKPPVHKIQNTHARKIYLKAEKLEAIVALYQKVSQTKRASSLFYTPGPLTV
jgi:primosomal protein N' (replication factor Y)